MPPPWEEQQPNNNSTEQQQCSNCQSGDLKLLTGYLNSSGHADNDNVPLQNNEALLDQDGSAVAPRAGVEKGLLGGPEDGRPAFVHPFPLNKRRYMVAVFSLMAALISADQNLLAPHLTQAAEDFGFDSTQKDQYLGGYIMAAFFMVGAPAAMVVGWLADRTNRRNLLFLVVLIGSTPCLATYWVTKYWQLLLLRTMTGISVGGSFPLVYSLLADLFPTSQRAVVTALVQIATGVGLAAGQGLSGLTGNSNWRIPFVIVAAPNFALAIVMLYTTDEPPRGAFEEALRGAYADGETYAYTETITLGKLKTLLAVPSNWLIFIQGLPGSLPWGMMQTFFNDYLSQDKGFSIQLATLIVLLYGLGGAAGVIGGGALGQHLYNKKKEYMPLMVGCTVFLGIAPLAYLVNAPLDRLSIGGTVIISILGGFLASVAGPNLRAVLMNVNEPETRGVAFALQTTTDDLGKGLGPFIVAWFIKYMGRQGAFNLSTAGWIPCGVLLGSLVFCMRKDEAAMQSRLEARITAMQLTNMTEGRGATPTPTVSETALLVGPRTISSSDVGSIYGGNSFTGTNRKELSESMDSGQQRPTGIHRLHASSSYIPPPLPISTPAGQLQPEIQTLLPNSNPSSSSHTHVDPVSPGVSEFIQGSSSVLPELGRSPSTLEPMLAVVPGGHVVLAQTSVLPVASSSDHANAVSHCGQIDQHPADDKWQS